MIFIGISDNVFCQVEATIDNIAVYFPVDNIAAYFPVDNIAAYFPVDNIAAHFPVDNIAAYFPIAAFSERLLPHSWGPMR